MMDGSREELKQIILGRIRQDPLAADLRWSFFLSALQSYRCDSVLRPFPPRYIDDDGEKRTDTLKAVADEIPGIFQLSAEINYISDEALELLAWALDNSLFQILTLNKSEFRNIQMKTGHVTSVPEPSFVFEVLHGQTPEQKFESLLNGRKLMYAYHGSRIENFHSILHSGLANHMNKVSLFGKGIYLSSELAVSLMYSPGGQGWSESQLGANLGCVAVCQLIDDPSVKCTVKEDDMTEPSTSKNRARASESQAGDVPERYYVVENNEMVRIKYLLVYCEPTSTHRERSLHAVPWYRRNRFAVLMTLYLCVLLVIGLWNSRTFSVFLRKFLYSVGFS